jgi:hypothetical protein
LATILVIPTPGVVPDYSKWENRVNAEGLFSQDLFVADGGEISFVSTDVSLSQAQLETLLADDGADDGVTTFTPSSSVDNPGPNYLPLDLSHPSAVLQECRLVAPKTLLTGYNPGFPRIGSCVFFI